MEICLLNAPASFLIISTKPLQNCENDSFFLTKIGKIILNIAPQIQNPIYSDRNGEFVYRDFKIIYKRFESARTKAEHERS